MSDNRTFERLPSPKTVFAEGLALHGEQLHLLSWSERRDFVFDLQLRLLHEFRFGGEGWGLASDGQQLVRSDGSAQLTFMDPATHRELRQLAVHDDRGPATPLNELEFARGWLLANIWYSDRIALIAPASGRVGGWLDLAPLRARLPSDPGLPESAVLNGIAYDAAEDLIYVTGKWWPRLFALRLQWPGLPTSQ